MNSWQNPRRMSKPPGNSLDFFLSKQTRVENDLSSDNELEESLIITENNSLSLDHSNEDMSITAHPNHMDIGLFVTVNQSVDVDLRLEILHNCWTPPENYIYPAIIQGGRKRYFNGC